jgi:choline monooxygenase
MSIGVAHEVAEPGDAKPVSVAGWPLVMVRGRDDVARLHQYLRASRHEPGRRTRKGLSTIRCPWHSWTYDLEGKLIAQPNIGGVGINKADGFDKEKLGLREVRPASG